MIASIHGQVIYKTSELKKDSYLVIEAAGVGYKIFTPASRLANVNIGDEVIAYTYLSVSEYAMDLYGFLDMEDKTFFMLLLDVPGIGSKSAIGILEKTTMKEVQQAILDNDPTILTKMAGLGAKTAEKIIMALKDKVESLSVKTKGKNQVVAANLDSDAFEALVSFGYSNIEARKALGQVDSTITDSGQRVKEALKILNKN
ncbi:MAG: Holliday junction branch migration protein RuvA [Candidatus Buchananbacteria bacterium]|nr:Holliday junction branch migration protein RuvA [Candidatus Buchananbacteria bacterium]